MDVLMLCVNVEKACNSECNSQREISLYIYTTSPS